MRFLTLEDIISINRYQITETFGFYWGEDNIQNLNGLVWVLDFIQDPTVYGEDTCPTILEKAAYLGWTIINDHVFFDGNKRTGMSSMIIFLLFNHVRIIIDEEEIVEMALRIVNYRETGIDKRTLALWLDDHVID